MTWFTDAPIVLGCLARRSEQSFQKQKPQATQRVSLYRGIKQTPPPHTPQDYERQVIYSNMYIIYSHLD